MVPGNCIICEKEKNNEMCSLLSVVIGEALERLPLGVRICKFVTHSDVKSRRQTD